MKKPDLEMTAPRYTSYPTAPVWSALPDERWHEALSRVTSPASVYVHIPFCREQCWFCGCTMVVAGRQDAGDRYLDALERQIVLLATPPALPVARIHLGGGTPTWLSTTQLGRLYRLLDRRFRRIAGAEISVEVDPDVTSDDALDALADLGVTRISLGVQSFDARVLEAIHRPQDPARVHALAARSRQRGMSGLNVDLVYGLPHQSVDSLAATLDEVERLAPDRLALYGYAHVPWIRSHQKRIDEAALPSPEARQTLERVARERLTKAGYVAIGFDHYARPDDELAVAQRERRLHRNFMGFTTRPELEVVGLGMSAISEVAGVYAQQRTRLGTWYRAIDGREPVIEKGCLVTADDRARRSVIYGLLCNFEARVGALGTPDRLERYLEAGYARVDGDRLEVTEAGRPWVRAIAAAFDAYVDKPTGARYSRVV